MIYTFKQECFNKFEIFEINKMRPRSYYIPFRSLECMNSNDYLTERYNSDMVTVLNGIWNMLYFDDCRKLETEFDTQANAYKFSKIKVPGCIQYQGVEPPCYVNQRYEFKPKLPDIPKDSPVTLFHKIVNLEKVSDNEVLTFLGVSSCLELYINGEFVGYSEGSHNQAEFNVAQYLQNGENEIVCLVYKWCNGSYLECQDMFRNTGIFRDVYLTHYGATFIRDFTIEPRFLSKGRYELYIWSDVVGSLYSLIYTIKKGEEVLHTITTNSGEKIRYILDNAIEWTAETPELYTLEIQLIDNKGMAMCLRRDFGLKDIKIRGNVLYFNDVAIKIRGVNHHDSNESNGYYMTVQDYLNDIESMKEYNVNSVRTSHYPPDPIFILMCEHYGLYVIDEADIETHGVLHSEYWHPRAISHNLKWKEHYWDRVRRMYERDKNSVAVTMWSLGNESHGYKCQDYCYNNLKKVTNIPIHYEAVIRTKRFAYDVCSEMYSSQDKFQKYLDDKLPQKFYNKPYMLCEYAHSMGVGPGDLDLYWDLWYKKASLLGGLIWEWRDHVVKHTEKGAKYLYTYGGDHGEKKHDSNFCVDGLLYPDGRPHTGALCMKNVYSPVRTYKDNNSFVICNRQDFLSTENIDISWVVYESGYEQSKGVVEQIIPPKEYTQISPYMVNDLSKDAYVIFTYTSKITGKILGEDCLILNENLPKIDIISDNQMINSGENLRINFDGGVVVINLLNGLISSYKINGVQLLNNKPLREDGLPGLVGNVYSAPIDNYMYVTKILEKQGISKLKVVFDSINYTENPCVVKTTHLMVSNGKPLIKYNTTYTIGKKGEIKINSEFISIAGRYDLPKIGYNMEMAKDFSNIEYYGYGNVENYPDFKNQASLGIYKTTTSDMLEPYIKPQDSGNRCGVRWVKVTNNDGLGLQFIAEEKPFNFNARTTTEDNLISAKHLEDVKVMELNNIIIDGFVRGVGSNSCGPDTRDKFKFILSKQNPFKFSFVIMPIKEASKD